MCVGSIWPGVIGRYGPRLAIDQQAEPVTLGEGNTPLIEAPRLAKALGHTGRLFLKYEGLNPTGSFKDRGMTTAITEARAEGARAVICASTGNTAASAAAYAARAGLHCYVVIPDGKIALGKLAGALAYGGKVLAIQGSFDTALSLVREACANAPVALVNSVNPARLEGQKTAAWEICEALGSPPDWLALPVGNAGNITAYWLGFNQCDLCRDGKPRLLGGQATGAAPIVLGRVVKNPETVATAIRIGNPARWKEALTALEESRGLIRSATDIEILDSYRMIASLEGVFCEPSSAAGIAVLRQALREEPADFDGRTIVAVLTGNGLKDPDSAILGADVHRIGATLPDLLEAIRP
jgi:threonine synthase